MKEKIKYILQNIFGFKNYLKVFSIFKIYTLKWDSRENDFFKFLEMLPESGLVVDAGANIGIMTYYLSKKMKKGKVISFEPMPDNFETLQFIVDFFKLKNVELYPFAIGNENKDIEMVMPVFGNVKQQGLTHVAELNDDTGVNHRAKMIRMADFDPIRNAEFVGMKMDIENYEYYALKGTEEILQKNKTLIYCEVWENEHRDKCFDLMKDLGYKIEVLIKNKLVGKDKVEHDKQNFFFVPI